MMINIPLICIILAVLACVYASYSDLKKGVIQNKLTLPLIGAGIILNSVYALMIGKHPRHGFDSSVHGRDLYFWIFILEIRCMGWWEM